MSRLSHTAAYLVDMQMHPKFLFHWTRGSGWRMERARNPYIVYWLVLSGEGRLRLADADVPIRAGDLVTIPPHAEFSAVHAGRADTPLEYAALGCDCRVGSLHLTEYYDVPPVAAAGEEMEELRRVFASLQIRWEPFVARSRPELAEYVRIQSLLHHWVAVALRAASAEPSRAERAADSRVHRVCVLLEERYAEKWTLREMAESVHLSESHLRWLFKRCLRLTPMEYLQRIRLRKAKEQMQRTDEPIRAIAEQAGFEDWSYFSRVFRKVEGVAPSVYRQKHAAVAAAVD